MRTTILLTLALLLACAAIPTASAGPKVCVESDADCYYVLYGNCVSAYDDNDAGDAVGYACTRPLGACLFQYPDGDGTTCARLLMSNGSGETCVVNFTTWEYAGYTQLVCVGIPPILPPPTEP